MTEDEAKEVLKKPVATRLWVIVAIVAVCLIAGGIVRGCFV